MDAVSDGNDLPAGLDDDAARLAWLRQAYYGLDGRWYLKLRERTDPTFAQEVDEAVTNSLGRLHVRAWRELTGVSRIDDCRTLGRFVRDVFDVLYDGHQHAFQVVSDTSDRFEMQHVSCAIFDMGAAAGYDAQPVPGQLPGCGGIRALVEGWAEEAGPFEVEQRPGVDDDGRLACRYLFTRSALG